MTQISVRGGNAVDYLARRGTAALAWMLALLALAVPGLAAAQDGGPMPADLETIGIAQPWQLGYQPAASPMMDSIYDFHDLLLVLIFVISVFVLLLMLYVMVRFRASKNPNPSRTSHNTLIEVVWTVVPVLILVVIAIPSFRLLYFEDRTIEADLVVKATGHQWYWSYEYPDEGIVFDQLMVADADLKPGQPRLLETDTAVVVPVEKKVRVLTTASDVLHSWTIPAFGIKQDSVPGRINETWFLAERPGIYYGQCSELCGVNHAFMPIKVVALEQADYDRWLAWAKNEYAAVDPDGRKVASAGKTAAAADSAAK